MGVRDRATTTERVAVGVFGLIAAFGGMAMQESSFIAVFVLGFLMFLGGILVLLAAVNDEV